MNNLIKKIAESNVKTITVMGSMHEIGFFEGCINENTPCNPFILGLLSIDLTL